MTIVGIHQPLYLPWIGFFKKIISSDIFVIYDDVQFERKGWQNRNLIYGSDGQVLLSVPVKSHLKSKINEVSIENQSKWAKKHKNSILFSYSKSTYFDEMKEFLEIYDSRYYKLIDLNMEIINFITKKLKIKTKIIFSSSMEISDDSSKRILEICKKLNADTYVTGVTWARENLSKREFENSQIELKFQELQHPIYRQSHRKFISNLSVIDLLFNEGIKRSREIIDESKII